MGVDPHESSVRSGLGFQSRLQPSPRHYNPRMARKLFRKFMPSVDKVREFRALGVFGDALFHPALWHLNRRSAAGGVAVGLFCGLIPGPLQMLGAAIVCLVARVNLPLAIVTTVYTNPFTIVPLYLLAYKIGSFALGAGGGKACGSAAARLGLDARSAPPSTRWASGCWGSARRWRSASSCSPASCPRSVTSSCASAGPSTCGARGSGGASAAPRASSRRRSGGRELSVLQAQDAVAARRQFRVVADDHDRRAAFPREVHEHIEDGPRRVAVEVAGRLVGQHAGRAA